MWLGRYAKPATFWPATANWPRCRKANLLAVLDTGAYGMSLASNYNSRPRPAEVLVDGKRVAAGS